MHARVIMSFTFPMAKTCPKRRLIGTFQPTNFDSKPDTEKKDERERNFLVAMRIYCGLFQSTRDIFFLPIFVFVSCVMHDAEIGIFNLSA